MNTPSKVIQKFKEAYQRDNLFRKRSIPKKFLFKKKKLKLKIPDYPGNILWENFEYENFYKIKSILLLTFIIIVIFIISFFINLFLTAFSESKNHDVDCGNIKVSWEDVLNSLESERGKLKDCFCFN